MADLLDLVDLDEAKRSINLDPSLVGQEDALGSMVTAVSRRVDELCGPVVYRTISNEQHSGGVCTIVPRYTPVSSITTLTEYSGTTPQVVVAEAFPTVTAYDYWIDPVTSFVHRRSSGYESTFAGTRVILTYVAGRYATTASVDAKFKEATAAILRRLWARDAAAWARGGDPFAAEGTGIGFFRAVDPMVNEYLGAERKFGFG